VIKEIFVVEFTVAKRNILKGWELNILKEKKSHGLKDHPSRPTVQ